jgi:hypothetical protein
MDFRRIFRLPFRDLGASKLDADAWRLGFFHDALASDYRRMLATADRFRAFYASHRERLGIPFYIVVIPRTLDLLEVCLAFVPESQPLVLILNGLESWESAYVERHYPNILRFDLEESRPMSHGCVLDMLMECNESNFGIMDQDCFVLDPHYFARLQLGSDYAVSPFVSFNAKANITFPRTYFLLFNIDEIRRLRNTYQLSCNCCSTLPRRIKAPLRALGLGPRNFPHAALDYFDTFQLIWAMAMHEGLTFGRGPAAGAAGSHDPNIVHVGAGSNCLTKDVRDGLAQRLSAYGAISQLEKEKLCSRSFSYYAHMRLLENSRSDELRGQYLPFYRPLGTAETFLDAFRSMIQPRQIEDIDRTIEAVRRVG